MGCSRRFGLDSNRELNELTVAELKQFGDEFGDDFHDSVTLKATLDCHDVIGGTARLRVRQALAEASERIKATTREAVHAGA